MKVLVKELVRGVNTNTLQPKLTANLMIEFDLEFVQDTIAQSGEGAVNEQIGRCVIESIHKFIEEH